ncbi:hypothetical protein E1267_07300 [Nonomuraea longispora]|uniref:Uncharacterized protein n=1 Tax=Nonomuraea longispora TaxID=1848320 RepID=A0A4R4NNM3_9ACTN|nr:hypothetical protein [Nonomuraea longispora]TDC09453.1 hypothetical protein E1267_07300 [Nonomuraea longispora]
MRVKRPLPLPFEVDVYQLPVVLLSMLSTLLPAPEPRLPEPRVFPFAVPGVSPSGARVTYMLAGVAPEAACPAAFQPSAVGPGCRTALRATYADSTGTYVATVGIAVLDGPQLTPSSAGRPATVRPVAFPGGPAERFGDRQYVTGVVLRPGGRYVVAAAAGYADGRAYQPGEAVEPRLRAAASQLVTALHRALTG